MHKTDCPLFCFFMYFGMIEHILFIKEKAPKRNYYYATS